MKKQLLFVGMLISSISFAQTDRLWSETSKKANSEILENKTNILNPKVYQLDINGLKNALAKAPKRLALGEKSEVIISFPNSDGKMENFKIRENSNFDPQLAAKYPDIKSYVGEGLTDSNSTIYFSISPLGLSSMEIYGDKSAVFIEPYTKDLSSYVVYKKSDKKDDLNKFECTVIDVAQKGISNVSNLAARPNADDAKLRTFRLALSSTGEYTAYFGGTKALALAAMNNTMTRVNGVFEKDFAARMVLIANNDAVIYTSASTDPYSAAAQMSNWNSQLQSTLTSVIGEANYDVGHLFGASGGGGNAGCIGCVCVNGSKGSGYTSPSDGIPSGDNFDIDYVAHELGHQFGGNHTFSHANEGTGVNMEPGSGSTIMGYAGITAQDIQPHSDSFFHAISIQQITDNIKAKTCPTSTSTGNSIPTANAGLDFTIPKGTPFMLTGSGTDANGDSLTYIWEQINNASSSQTGASSAASATKATGPTFRSWTPTTTPVRYFPRMASVLTGATTTAGSEITVEALSNVARTYNFRFTVRDNRAGGSGNNSDDAVITVNGTAGPFSVSSQNTATTYTGGTSQTVTWNVAGTTANGVNAANVDILWSTDNGNTWTTLLSGTPNDGSQAVTIPNLTTTTGRIMVKGSNHIFFDVNNANISVNAGSGSTDIVAPTAPTLSASGTTSTSTNLSWSGATDAVGVTGYDVYQGASLIGSTASTTYTVNSLSPSTTYSFTVRAKDAAGNISTASNTATVTTLAGSTVTYCTATATNTADERIGNVTFGSINNTSTGTAGYENFTSISTNVTRGTANTISITPVWTSTKYNEAYAVYIDYNRDGDFTDSGELAWTRAGSQTTPVTGSITIPATASLGSTRMRVMMQYSSIPSSSCGSYTYGQVEDYTLNILSSARGEDFNINNLMTDIKLYPNPARDVLNISNTTVEDYKIFDMGGKLINSGKIERGTVNVSQLTAGAYTIQIGETSKRFIKK
ncbi:T9SS type A sorting domain-containing protein [Chryseobacterium aquaticum]|uniref:T9SS type A sorting domain-containing protein n=1 Tax=Chryseobacterium aquaticum TaxID=452084 RepID=A0A848MX58_9FLAO|nr:MULTISPECIES: zinc-dependent metalloprotease family protein [Chryseobacterium]NMR32706.1 T9SS type A sorting domain-containing protein [Chryseobacterium aquaticum]NRQ45364.1 T9SS type A sorting domain-containing protein [Chryseobacterium sp. C-204]